MLTHANPSQKTTMATVIIILKDTPAGRVSVHSNFVPAVGQRITLAQSIGLDLIHTAERTFNTTAEAMTGVEVTQKSI